MSRFTPTAEDIRNLRDAEQISMCEAKRQLRQDALLREVRYLRDERFMSDREKFDRLLDVVEDMLVKEG